METARLCFWGPRLGPALVLGQRVRGPGWDEGAGSRTELLRAWACRWVFAAAALPPARLLLLSSATEIQQPDSKSFAAMNRMEPANRPDPGAGFRKQKYRMPGDMHPEK